MPTGRPPLVPLRALGAARGVTVGAAVNGRPLGADATYREVLAREFGAVTCTNAMKFGPLQPERGRFDFAPADEIVAFGRDHGMAVRGHTLVWHRQNPEWIAALAERETAALWPALRAHIQAVMEHYRGQVAAWDVVNEAVADDGSPRDTLWLRALGAGYVAHAFRWAHEADPGAPLFYNDYGADGLGPKADAVHALLCDLLDQGVPVHGVGLQMHVGLGRLTPDPDAVAAHMRRLGALGLEVHVTEMDVRLQTGSGPLAERPAEQARVYERTLAACLSERACTSVTFWGFTDRHSWIPSFTGQDDAPLLFDPQYQPKPAYHAVARALSSQV
ncbi:MAG: GH10 [uncultured Chloroflexi bacterium]|uniref:Beta-xylanase n=1 Tax=uncultured Chloroflexota bacterium TaxID=166587 RepID=A0A6J4JMI7_9CHLR|nr:MAG: GH10 [uncultured Chloroflexota bacterium]